MSTTNKRRLSPLQKTWLGLLIALLTGIGIYRVIGPEPPLPEPARTELESQARVIEQRIAEDQADGESNPSKWMTAPLTDAPAETEPPREQH
ncbi:hypothetical protein [Methylobacillus sp.]|uniref:hypothetical protein n=1 Tax=Methylobacillus sp. TaxID=56818 RepID=UPI0012CCF7DC|nr:hypothetical protein [Methylobacillus sp.]MPS48012.1 hypothetical protein [Methylobacillus sp.]